MCVFLRSMSSNEDQSAMRDPEEKETEEVKVDGRFNMAKGKHFVGHAPVGTWPDCLHYKVLGAFLQNL